MTGESAHGLARAGRPRSTQVDVAISSAALELIAETGFDATTIEAVASRADVSKATIYRRFSGRDELIATALALLNETLPARNLNVSTRDQLVDLLDWVRTVGEESRIGQIGRHIMGVGCHRPDISAVFFDQVVLRRRQAMREILQAGISSGEIRPDIAIDVVIGVLSSPIAWMRLWPIGYASPTRETVEQVVDTVVFGISPSPASDS